MKASELSMVKIRKNIHTRAKLFAVKNGLKMYDVVGTATSEYLNNQDKKEIKQTEKTE